MKRIADRVAPISAEPPADLFAALGLMPEGRRTRWSSCRDTSQRRQRCASSRPHRPTVDIYIRTVRDAPARRARHRRRRIP